jgi:cytoskeletal protein CcmA (bactofilin family)
VITVPPLPHGFLFLAEEFVESKKHKLIEGDVHSNNDIEIKKGKKSDIVGDLFAVDDIEIGKKNDVEGDVTAGSEVDNDGDVDGTITEGAAVAVVPLPVITPFAVGTDPIEVEKKGSLDLAIGSYGNVEVEKEGTLKLSSGEYFMKSLELSKKAKLCIEISGGLPVIINISDDLVFGKSSEVLIKPGGEAQSDLLTFNFTDDDDNNGDDDFVKIGKKAKVLGTIIAPDAWVVLQSKSRFKGAICAENIVVKSKVVALHHSVTDALPKIAPDSEDDPDEEEVLIASMPTEYELGQNYPNPFNPSTTIHFAVPKAGEVTLAIYNLRGQLVGKLHSGPIAAGRHQMVWDGKDARGLQVATGVYVYRLEADGFVATKKLTLMK